MPNYDFQCECGHSEEKFLWLSQRDRIFICPKCGKVLTRLIGKGSGIIFKGSGFYETDYKKKEK